MKGIVWTFAVALAAIPACGGDDGGSGVSADAQAGVGEPANLVGITLAHNQVRAMVDTSGIAGGPLPPMVWDPDLAAHAKAWAEMCVDTMAPSGLVDHSSQAYRTGVAGYSYIGENIFAQGSAPASGELAVDTWASEKANFTYPNGCSGVCGHYTQVVWRDSVNLGCANVACNSLQYKGTVLCQYGPGGNGGGAPY
jgi:hypothetical protein